MERIPPKLFVSHSKDDLLLVSKLVDISRIGLGLEKREIMCTSLLGYGVKSGEDIVARIRSDGISSNTLLCLLTPQSLESTWVMFELGARWGSEKHLVLLLGCGASVDDLPPPLRNRSAVLCTEEGLELLFNDIADELDVVFDHVTTRKHIKDLVAINLAIPHLDNVGEYSIYKPGKRNAAIARFVSPKDRQLVEKTFRFSIEVSDPSALVDSELWLVQIESGLAWPKQKIDDIDSSISGTLVLGGSPPGNAVTVSLAAFEQPDAERVRAWYKNGIASGSFPGFESLPDTIELDSVTIMIAKQ